MEEKFFNSVGGLASGLTKCFTNEITLSDVALRDYFAGLAMQALLEAVFTEDWLHGQTHLYNIPADAYRLADKMLEARCPKSEVEPNGEA